MIHVLLFLLYSVFFRPISQRYSITLFFFVSSCRFRESSQDYSSRTLWAAHWHEKWPGCSICQLWPVLYWRLQKPLQTEDRDIQWHCWWVDGFFWKKGDWKLSVCWALKKFFFFVILSVSHSFKVIESCWV